MAVAFEAARARIWLLGMQRDTMMPVPERAERMVVSGERRRMWVMRCCRKNAVISLGVRREDASVRRFTPTNGASEKEEESQ